MRKSGKRPTLKEKKLIKNARLRVDNWLVQKKDSEFLYLVNRATSKVRKIPLKERS